MINKDVNLFTLVNPAVREEHENQKNINAGNPPDRNDWYRNTPPLFSKDIQSIEP